MKFFKLFLVNFKRLNNIIKSNKLSDISKVKLNPLFFESSEEEEIFEIIKKNNNRVSKVRDRYLDPS